MGDISNEPSMEHILASIKRIIAEDPVAELDTKPHVEERTMAEAKTEAGAIGHGDVLELAADQVAVDEPASPLLREKPVLVKEPILSAASVEASRASLSNLSKMIVRQDDAASNTLEGLVRDLLKPMIKPWLDANLPAIVERAVAQEVARLTGRDL